MLLYSRSQRREAQLLVKKEFLQANITKVEKLKRDRLQNKEDQSFMII
jgi:hypothetical protein